MSYWRIRDPKERAKAKAEYERRIDAKGHYRHNGLYYSWPPGDVAQAALCRVWANTGVPQLVSLRATLTGHTITVTTPGGWSVEIDQHECAAIARAVHSHLQEVLKSEHEKRNKQWTQESSTSQTSPAE